MSHTTPVLSIELVPQTCWFSNLRSELTPEEWTRIKKATSRAAKYRCEICGGRGPQWPVECHERWIYDDITQTQTLEGVIALCPACHEVKHIGFAESRGRLPEALGHLARVNRWSMSRAIAYAEAAFNVWAIRSQVSWRLDLTWLEQFNICVGTQAGKGTGCNPVMREFDPHPALQSPKAPVA